MHCAIVAAGGSKHDDILVADHGGHVFVALDNGILTQVLEDRGVVYRVDLSRVPVAPVRRTLHTRDIVAPIGALLASGKLAVEDCGPEEPDPKRIRTWPTKADGDTIDGVVVGEGGPPEGGSLEGEPLVTGFDGSRDPHRTGRTNYNNVSAARNP